MAYTTINKSTDYFNTKLYTGNSSTLNVTGVGHQPDFVWIKDRSSSGDDYAMYDAVRGVNKRIRSNQNDAESTESAALTSFDSDGFTVGTAGSSNGNGDSFASWNWKANGAGSANTDGSINSTVSVNTTAGFSIVSYTGTGSNATIGHGLGAAPQVVLIKELNGTNNWLMSHQPLSASLGDYTRFLTLNSTGAVSGAGNVVFQNSAFTSSVFNVGTSAGSNGSGQNYIAYCFAEKTGYSKIGSFTGNGNADGTFAYLGFRPAFILVRASNLTTNWHLYDNKRDPINPADTILRANSSNVDATNSEFAYDFVSNGFKARSSGSEFNGSGNTFIYYAVGQSLVGSNNVPCTAR